MLAIAPPIDRSAVRRLSAPFLGRPGIGRKQRDAEASSWTAAERELLEQRVAKLVESRVLTRAVFLPSSLTSSSDEGGDRSELERLRSAAVRVHADAVLVVHRVCDAHVSSNALSILDLTILGFFTTPGYTVKVRSAMEAYVVDTYNEYLDASEQADAEAQQTIAGAYVEQKSRDLLGTAQDAALEQLTAGLLVQRSWL